MCAASQRGDLKMLYEIRPLRGVKYEPRHFEQFVTSSITAAEPFSFYISPTLNDVGNRIVKFQIRTLENEPTLRDTEIISTYPLDLKGIDGYNVINTSKFRNYAMPYWSIIDPPAVNIMDTLVTMCIKNDVIMIIHSEPRIDQMKIKKKEYRLCLRLEHAGLGSAASIIASGIHGGLAARKGDFGSAARGPQYGNHPTLKSMFNEAEPKMRSFQTWTRISLLGDTRKCNQIAASISLMNAMTISTEKAPRPTALIGSWKSLVMSGSELANLINFPSEPAKYPISFGTTTPSGHAFPTVKPSDNKLAEFMQYQ